MGWEKGIRQEVSLHPRIKSPFSEAPGASKGHPGVTLVLRAPCSILSLSVPFVPGLLQSGQDGGLLPQHSLLLQDHPDQRRDLGFDCTCPVPVEQGTIPGKLLQSLASSSHLRDQPCWRGVCFLRAPLPQISGSVKIKNRLIFCIYRKGIMASPENVIEVICG